MKPALAYHLVNTFTEPGEVILDPFSGAGTIPFEAALNGRFAYAMDISQLSFVISQGKLTRPKACEIETRLEGLKTWLDSRPPSEEELQNVKAVKFNGPIHDYFHEKTFSEILSARKYFAVTRDDSPEWALLLASMLHILHGKKCDMGKELAAIGAEIFEVVDCFNEDVQHCESHGVTDKGTVTGHQYLVLRNR